MFEILRMSIYTQGQLLLIPHNSGKQDPQNCEMSIAVGHQLIQGINLSIAIVTQIYQTFDSRSENGILFCEATDSCTKQ